MSLKNRIDDLYDRFESIESELHTVTGVLTRTELEMYQAAGFTIGDVLVVPDHITEEEWLAMGPQMQEKQRLIIEESLVKYSIPPAQTNAAPVEAPQRPYQEPHIHRNNPTMGRG